MAAASGRHGTHWAPRSPALLREVLAALRTPEPPARRRAADPDRAAGIAAALAAESGANPAWTHAVAFRTCRPIRMPINSGTDYDLFAASWQARRAMLGEQSDTFAEPELWELGGGGWHRAERPEGA